MGSRRWIILGNLAGITLLIAHAIPIQGARGSVDSNAERPVATPVFQDSEASVLADLALIATGKGWTIDQAWAYHRSEQEVGRIGEVVAANGASIFVGTALSADPDGTPSLFIKGAPPSWVRELVSEAAVPIRMIPNQPYSFLELEDRKQAVHDALMRLGTDQVVTGVDIQSAGRIRVTVGQVPGRSQSGDWLVEVAPDLRDDVDLTVVEGLVVVPDGAFGGMRTYDGSTPWCTSGWTVIEEGTGLRGVSTAGHCNATDGLNHPGHALHAGTWRTRHLGQYGDVGWFTTTQTEADDYYADASTIRDVASIESAANFSVGELICGYGRASNDRDCSLAVHDVSISCGNLSRLVQMDGNTLTGGDSGGGWSFADRAFGGHQGDCGGLDSFTKATHFDEALNIDVATS